MNSLVHTRGNVSVITSLISICVCNMTQFFVYVGISYFSHAGMTSKFIQPTKNEIQALNVSVEFQIERHKIVSRSQFLNLVINSAVNQKLASLLFHV